MSLANELNSRIDIYSKIQIKNELGEIDYTYRKIKSIWAEITPQNGSIKEGQGNTKYVDISHKVVVRANSIINLTNDMYFMFKGQRYNTRYFNPNYKYKDRIEIFCSLVVE